MRNLIVAMMVLVVLVLAGCGSGGGSEDKGNMKAVTAYADIMLADWQKAPATGKVVVVGDSITGGLDGVFVGYPVFNRGIGGMATGAQFARVIEVVGNEKPAMAFVMIGANDIGNGEAVGFIERQTAHIKRLKELSPNTKVIVVSITPVTDASDGSVTRNAIIDIANDNLKAVYGVDFIYINDQFKHKAELYKDFIHPNLTGSCIIRDTYIAKMKELGVL